MRALSCFATTGGRPRALLTEAERATYPDAGRLEQEDSMASSDDHLRLYGFLRRDLLSRYFALGRERRNDFYQESTSLLMTREEILQLAPAERTQALWRKTAPRTNPWLLGCSPPAPPAPGARLGPRGPEPLLDRLLRSCER